MTYDRMLMLSLRPRFTDLILDDQKSIELRRQPPLVAPCTPILLYSSSPVMAVLGFAILDSIVVDDPQQIWAHYGERTGVTNQEYYEYTSGTRRVSALALSSATSFRTPLALSTLRDRLQIEPPQSYRYLSRSQVELLVLDSCDRERISETCASFRDQLSLELA